MTEASHSFTISELARATAMSVASIKFYLREELLPPGDLTAEKRAYYDESHARRLRLIHTLRQVAGLSVPAIRAVCRQLDAPRGDLASAVLHVIDALGGVESGGSATSAKAQRLARRELSGFLRARGLRVRTDSPALVELADALLGLRELFDSEVSPQSFVPYLDAMLNLAEQDFAATRHLLTDPGSAGLAVTYGTVLYEPVLTLLRRIAHEHVAMRELRGLRTTAKRGGR